MDRRSLLIGAGARAASAALPVRAQAYPSRSVALYCTFPAGGPTDIVMRAFAESATRIFGQSVVVENKPGASGTLAPLGLRTVRPDGHILSQSPISLFRIPHMQKQPTFDPLADFTYIINMTGYTFGFVVPADSQWKSIKELVDWAKANPNKFNYGSTGIGTSPHLAVEEFAAKAGIKLNHVPFKGNADLMQAILGGHVMGASDSTGWAPHVEAGKLRILATYGSKRTKRWPQIPTLTELGYETVSDSPFGLCGPKGMDPGLVRTIHDGFRKVLEDPKVVQVLDRYDQSVAYMSSEEYTAYARRTFEAERGTIERLGLRGTI